MTLIPSPEVRAAKKIHWFSQLFGFMLLGAAVCWLITGDVFVPKERQLGLFSETHISREQQPGLYWTAVGLFVVSGVAVLLHARARYQRILRGEE